MFYVFQSRDIIRAQNLLHGQAIFWGPEMTGGGNLPGPFYYFLLAVSQLVSPGWQSAWIWLVALNCAGCLLGFFALRFAGLYAASYLWIAAFALAPKTAFFVTQFYNVSYMTIFVIASLICMQLAFLHPSFRTRQFAALAFFVFAGMGIQLHFTMAVIPAAFLITCIFHQLLNVKPPELKTLGLGCILFAVQLLPYAIWMAGTALGYHFGQYFEYAGAPHEAPEKIMSLIYSRIGPPDVSNFLWELRMNVPIVLPPLVIALAYLRFFAPEHVLKRPLMNFKPLLVVASLALIPIFFELISPQAFRYCMPFYVTLSALTVILFEQLIRSANPRAILIFVLLGIANAWLVYGSYLDPMKYLEVAGKFGSGLQGAAVFGCVVLAVNAVGLRNRWQYLATGFFLAFAILQSKPMLTKLTNRGRPMPELVQWESIWKEFRRKSDLDYPTAIERIYFVNHHKEQDPEISYRMSRPGAFDSSQAAADGYFVSSFFPGGDVLNWLTRQEIQGDVLIGLKSGKIRLMLEDNVRPQGNLVVGYKVMGNGPKYVQNTGEGYFRTEENRILDRIKAETGVERLANGDLLFKWNECENHATYCSTGAIVHLEKLEEEGRYSVRVRVIGSPLSQSSPWIHPEWTESWIEPYLEVQCGENKRRHELYSSIGYRRQYGPGPVRVMGPNNSVLAPFQTEFIETCHEGVKEIAVGRRSSEVEQINRIVEFAGTKLSVHL